MIACIAKKSRPEGKAITDVADFEFYGTMDMEGEWVGRVS